MGGGVDAVGQAADDGGAVGRELADEAVGVVAALGGGAAGADNGDRAVGVEVGGAHDVEQGRAVLGFGAVEALGIVGGGEEEGADAVLLAEGQFLLGTGEGGLALDVAEDGGVVGKDGLELGGGQGEGVVVGVEVDEAPDGGVAESGDEGEGYLREGFHGSYELRVKSFFLV